MTSKRDIKKYIARVGNEIAESVLPSAVYTKVITDEEADDILTKLSQLQATALAKIGIAYDKSAEAFDSLRAFHTAKKSYYRTAYNQVLKDFEDGVDKILAPLNKAKK